MCVCEVFKEMKILIVVFCAKLIESVKVHQSLFIPPAVTLKETIYFVPRMYLGVSYESHNK
jgi:hypothetical protein